MIKKIKLPTYEQDAAEVKNMLDFYCANFTEVYSLTCMNCGRVIGVEVAPIRTDGVVLEKKGRTLYTFDDLCLSVRGREDRTVNGKPMYGYQCACGNNTLLAKIEKGEVAERTIIKSKNGIVSDTGPIAVSSPYEMAKVHDRIAQKQADNSTPADYETNGTVERYETFKLERIK